MSLSVASKPSRNSTNVRSPAEAPPALRVVRFLARAVPPLGVRAALRLFATPPRGRAAEATRALFAAAEPFPIPWRGRRLRGWRWGAGPTVLLLHGWGGRAAQLAAFVEPLRARGLGVVAFDGPAHGGSPGRTSTIPQFAQALEAAAARVRAATGDGVCGVVAHSLGAAATTLALGQVGPARVVFVAPLSAPEAHFDAFLALVALGGARSAMRARAEEHYRIRWTDLDVLARARRAHSPLIVFHDRGDRRIPVEEGRALAAAWPGARLIETEGLGHNRILTTPDILNTTAAFIAGDDQPGGFGS